MVRLGEEIRGKECCVMVPHGPQLGDNCGRKPTSLIDGRYYCGFHQPDRVRARGDIRQEKDNANHASWQKRHARDMLILGLFGQIPVEVIVNNKESIREFLNSLTK